MTTSELREELLKQHEEIRQRCQAACQAVRGWADGTGRKEDLHGELAQLTDALRKHNLLEETALQDVVRHVDAYGPERMAIVKEAHVREHHDLFEALFAVGFAVGENVDAQEGVAALDRFRAHLLDHMAREEETFLNASVLRDVSARPGA